MASAASTFAYELRICAACGGEVTYDYAKDNCNQRGGRVPCSILRSKAIQETREPGYHNLAGDTLTLQCYSYTALVYSMDELDPYRDMPPPPEKESVLPTSDSTDDANGRSGFLGCLRVNSVDMSTRGDNGREQGDQVTLGRREDRPLSAQASRLALRFGVDLLVWESILTLDVLHR